MTKKLIEKWESTRLLEDTPEEEKEDLSNLLEDSAQYLIKLASETGEPDEAHAGVMIPLVVRCWKSNRQRLLDTTVENFSNEIKEWFESARERYDVSNYYNGGIDMEADMCFEFSEEYWKNE
jgi:hypothetical protein